MKLFRVVLLLAALAAVPILVVTTLRAQQGTPSPTVTTPAPSASSRTTYVSGREVGEVLIGSTVVLRLHESAGGLTPGQRTDIVASRLSDSLAAGHTWQDVRVGMRNNIPVLLIANNLLVTADRREASYNRTTPLNLAFTWQGNMQTALRNVTAPVVAGSQEQTNPPSTTSSTLAATQFPDWTNASTKVVPIVAAGTPGVSLGFAQVTGPATRVDTVRAVLQLSVEFQRAARIHAFVPSTSLTSLNRVQGVAVTALLQYQLFQF